MRELPLSPRHNAKSSGPGVSRHRGLLALALLGAASLAVLALTATQVTDESDIKHGQGSSANSVQLFAQAALETAETTTPTPTPTSTLSVPVSTSHIRSVPDEELTTAPTDSLSPDAPSSSPPPEETPTPTVTPTRTPTPTPTPTTVPTLPPPTPVAPLRTHHENFDDSVSRQHGIILTLHDGIIALGASLVKDLRCLGNQELIQIYHCLPGELSPESRDLLLLDETRLEIVDACTSYIDRGALTPQLAQKFRSYWIKPLALLHTDLQEPMLLDADAIPLRDPAVLRSLPGYVRTGTTFFYDRVLPLVQFFNANIKVKPSGTQRLQHWIKVFDYAAFNLTGPAPSAQLLQSMAYTRKTAHEMDSSMVAIDKARAGKALDVLWHLITHARFQFDFSWGDKEAFWLAYEFAHLDYYFSPWGVSVVSSSTNRDLEDHPNTLCGSIAQFLPVDDETPELLYVNGRALLDPFPNGMDTQRRPQRNLLYNVRQTHMTPRQPRSERKPNPQKLFNECLVDMGSTPLPQAFQWHLMRRRTFFMGIQAGFYAPLSHCNMF